MHKNIAIFNFLEFYLGSSTNYKYKICFSISNMFKYKECFIFFYSEAYSGR